MSSQNPNRRSVGKHADRRRGPRNASKAQASTSNKTGPQVEDGEPRQRSSTASKNQQAPGSGKAATKKPQARQKQPTKSKKHATGKPSSRSEGPAQQVRGPRDPQAAGKDEQLPPAEKPHKKRRNVGGVQKKLEERLLELMRQEDYTPLREEQLTEALKIEAPRDEKNLSRCLKRLVQEGVVAKIKNGRYILPRDADLVTGRIQFRQSGSAVLIPEASEGNRDSDTVYQVYAEDTAVSMHGDRVVAREIREPKRGGRRGKKFDADARFARVLQVLKRANETTTGTLMRARHSYYVVPDDPRIIQDILVPDPPRNPCKGKPKLNDKVVVKILEWKQRHLNPEGEIVEILGKTHEPRAEFASILRKYNLSTDFPEAVTREAENTPDKVSDQEIQGRKDCRGLFTLTIDPDDAKDFDDALSFERLEGGKVRVGIHIADVNAYVKPSSELMKEAKKRGNSTYLVGTVIPMLPHALSNGICSLVERQDRLTKSVFITFDKSGKAIDRQFANTVIFSRKRLTYKQAFAFLNEDSNKRMRELPLPPAHQTGSTGRALNDLRDDELNELRDTIRTLWKLASKERKRRMGRGSLDLDMPETKILVDEKGYADKLEKVENDESHQLIEEFMLMANENVAQVMNGEDLPCIYRVHDKPDQSSLDELRETMATHGIQAGDLSNRRQMSKLIAQINEHPQGHALKIHVLRAMKQAQYRTTPDGHYGLAKNDYLHFTSPIRRLADLLVHQSFDRYLKKHHVPSAPARLPTRQNAAQLASLAEHISITERNSMEAERESVKTKLLEYFERQLQDKERQQHEAVITEVKNHGMFIELNLSQAFGLIHISTLRDDLYHLSSDGTALVGRRTGREFQIGDKVQVEVDRVDRFKRQIDFRLAKG